MATLNIKATQQYWVMFTVKDLRAYCRQAGLTGYSRWDKFHLTYMLARLVRKGDPRAEHLGV